MPAKKMGVEQLQEAINLVEQYGSGFMAHKMGATDLPPATLQSRVNQARLRGLTPTVKKDAPRIYTRQRLGRMHLIIPDCQVKPNSNTDYLSWIASYICEKRPDVIVNIGDFADLESLSTYDRGTARGENRRLKADLASAARAMDKLVNPIRAIADYKPEMHLTMGNHEDRLDRFSNEHPELEEIVGTQMLNYADWGWQVHPFLKIVKVDGVNYCHFFQTGGSSRAVSSARALLNKEHCSSIMGHNQKTDVAFQPTTHQWAIFCGVCNLQDENYLGQGNRVRRQILVLHEVEEGRFDPMFVSLNYLAKAYS